MNNDDDNNNDDGDVNPMFCVLWLVRVRAGETERK